MACSNPLSSLSHQEHLRAIVKGGSALLILITTIALTILILNRVQVISGISQGAFIALGTLWMVNLVILCLALCKLRAKPKSASSDENEEEEFVFVPPPH